MKFLAISPVQRGVEFAVSSLGHRILPNVGWDTLGAVLGRGLTVLGMMVVARILGREAFGKLTMIYSTVLMFEIFAVYGLWVTTAKFVAAYRVLEPERTGRIISLCSFVALAAGGIIALGMATTAPWLARQMIAAPDLAGELRLGALLVFFSAWTATQTGALIGLESFRLLALMSAIRGGGTVLALTVGAATFGVEGALVALIAGSALGGGLNHFALRRAARRAGVPLRRSFAAEELPIIWRFSLPALVMGALWMPTNWAANAMLANTSDGYAQLGLLGVAMQWFVLLLFLPNIVARVLLPVITERVSADARDDAARVTRMTALLILMGVAAVAGCLALASPWIMVLYGDAYRGGAWTLAVVAIAAAAASPQNHIEAYFAARDRMWLNAAFNLLWATTMIVGASLLVDRGAVGIAMAMACAYTVRTLVSFSVFRVLSRGAVEGVS